MAPRYNAEISVTIAWTMPRPGMGTTNAARRTTLQSSATGLSPGSEGGREEANKAVG